MADFNVIKDTSLTLRNVLRAGLATVPPDGADVELHDLFTPVGLPPPRPLLTLTLYEIIEDPSARNRPNERRIDPATGRVVLKRAPMALLLRYFIAPWSGDAATDHLILGRAVQTLYDHAIISGPELEDGLRLANESLKVTMVPMSIEDRTHVWRSIESRYRLSANYEVRVVNLESQNEVGHEPVTSRAAGFGAVKES